MTALSIDGISDVSNSLGVPIQHMRSMLDWWIAIRDIDNCRAVVEDDAAESESVEMIEIFDPRKHMPKHRFETTQDVKNPWQNPEVSPEPLEEMEDDAFPPLQTNVLNIKPEDPYQGYFTRNGHFIDVLDSIGADDELAPPPTTHTAVVTTPTPTADPSMAETQSTMQTLGCTHQHCTRRLDV